MGKLNKASPLTLKKASTPQPQKKAIVTKIKKTPKSEPQPKRKKISQEIDEAISDEEFETTIKSVKELEKLKRKLGTITPKQVSPKKPSSEGDSEDDSDDVDLEDVDLDSDDIDISDEEDDSDDDEEDSEDDESDDLEDAGKGKSKLAAKFKEIMEAVGELGSSDEDDDDDDDAESSEDEEEPPPTKKKKVQNNVQTDKGNNKKQLKETEKKKDNKALVKESNQAKKRKREVTTNGAVVAVSKEDLELDKSVQADRDSRTLFVKLSGEVHEKRIHKLLSEPLKEAVLDVRIQAKGRAKKGSRQSNVYVEFKSKEEAAEAHSQIKKKNVVVDFVGQNSKCPEKSNKKKDPEEFDPLRLYISGFHRKATLADLKKVFPTASKLQLPTRKKSQKNVGYAFAHFKTIEECRKVHNSSGLTCSGRNLVLLYARKTSAAKKSDNRPQKLEDKVTAKTEKRVKKETSKKQEISVKTKDTKNVKAAKKAAVKQEEPEEDSSMDDEEESGEEEEDGEDMGEDDSELEEGDSEEEGEDDSEDDDEDSE